MKDKLLKLASEARAFSHSPYSKAQVGAALTLADGKTYSGCNIENASFGGTVCAERVAIWKAVSENKGARLQELVVVTENGWPPCGLCRQVMAEFAADNLMVHIANAKGIQKSISFQDLLPLSFNPEHLQK